MNDPNETRPPMELAAFVTTTLEQISRGVFDAQKITDELGGKINPRFAMVAGVKGSPNLQEIEFDVAVTVTEGSESGGGLQVGVLGIGAGFKGGSEARRAAENRVRFTVPVYLPSGGG